MANLTIKDSGYISVSQTGTQYDAADRVNSGNALELKGVSFDYSIDLNADDTPEPDNSNYAIVNQNSYENPKIIIEGVLKRGSLDGTGTELSVVPELVKAVKVKTVLCLYYDDTLTGTTGYPIITKFIGVSDSGSYASHPTEKHLHVRFTKFKLRQSGDTNSYRFTLEGTETA